jgi:hypothetical protein
MFQCSVFQQSVFQNDCADSASAAAAQGAGSPGGSKAWHVWWNENKAREDAAALSRALVRDSAEYKRLQRKIAMAGEMLYGASRSEEDRIRRRIKEWEAEIKNLEGWVH